MLWQILRGCGGRYSPQTWGYGQDEAADMEIGLLDPVDPQMTGKAKVAVMKKSMKHIAFAMRALMIITSLTYFMEEVAPAVAVRRLPTAERWWTEPTNHLKQLLDFELIAPVSEAWVLSVSTYFAIGKSDGTARSIFNGRALSESCNPPPPTNLPDVTRVLKVLEEMCRDCTTVSFMEGDIRHYFHQLPVEDDISRYFCLYMNKEFFRWKTVPMGWSWSPFVAQSIGMGLILLTLEKCGWDVTEYTKTDTPPPMIIIRDADNKISLIAALWYDNILVACRDPQKAPKIFAKFRQLAEKDFHLILKSWNFHGPRSFNPPAAEGEKAYPSYLGLEFVRLRKRSSPDAPLQLHWRIAPKRILQWEALREEIRRRMTCRTVAKIAGAILWRHHVFLTPLCRLEGVINIVRTCGTVCRRRADWDRKRVWSADERATLASALEVALTREWATQEVHETTTTICAAADSSKGRWGLAYWTHGQNLLECDSGLWGADHIESSIFVKELVVATMTIERICHKFPGSRILLLEDNTAAAAVLRKLASSALVGTGLALRVDRALTSSGCSLDIVPVTSQQNPADSPSRNRPLDPVRVEMMWNIVAAHLEGRLIQPTQRTRMTDQSPALGLRHAETEAADEFTSSKDSHSEWSSHDDDVEQPKRKVKEVQKLYRRHRYVRSVSASA